MSSTTGKEIFRFVYNGVQYDATDYAEKHPGGLDFLQNMKNVTHDFTQYFRALHSDSAEKILKSFPITSTMTPTKQSEQYNQIYKKIEPYFKPSWPMEFLLTALVTAAFLIGLLSPFPALSVLGFAFSQVVVGWMGHSAAHSRNFTLQRYGQKVSALVGGFSLQWWSPKHNMHHMFTNIQKYDSDIQHEYKVYLYQFLYLKWRFDSLVSAIKQSNYSDIILIVINYSALFYFHSCLLNFLIGQLIAGFYSAFVLIGNHEREKRFPQKPDVGFMDHQIVTCRNYHEQNWMWVLLMGGMQFQTEHHLFPQVPFYYLPKIKPIIEKELGRLNKTIIYGSVI